MEDKAFSDAFSKQLPLTPRYTPRKSRKRFFFLLAVIIIFMAWFGSSRFFGSKQTSVIKSTPTPTEFVFPTDTPIPSPTEEPEKQPTPSPTIDSVDKATGLDRSDLDVEIQNGSGVVGAASKASEVLKTFGYHVVSIKNAESFNYLDTVIFIRPEKNKYLPLLKKDIESIYTIGSASAALSASVSADVIVIVGQE